MRIDLGGGGEFVLDRIQTPASLSLNLEGTMNQGMQMASRDWIRHRKGFFLRASGAQVHAYLGVNQQDLSGTIDLQICQTMLCVIDSFYFGGMLNYACTYVCVQELVLAFCLLMYVCIYVCVQELVLAFHLLMNTCIHVCVQELVLTFCLLMYACTYVCVQKLVLTFRLLMYACMYVCVQELVLAFGLLRWSLFLISLAVLHTPRLPDMELLGYWICPPSQ